MAEGPCSTQTIYTPEDDEMEEVFYHPDVIDQLEGKSPAEDVVNSFMYAPSIKEYDDRIRTLTEQLTLLYRYVRMMRDDITSLTKVLESVGIPVPPLLVNNQ